MTLTEIIPFLKELSHQEKLKVIQFLAHELEQKDSQKEQIEHKKKYEVWSPYDAFSAEKILTQMLQQHSQKSEQ